jgi:hypothetical protein
MKTAPFGELTAGLSTNMASVSPTQPRIPTSGRRWVWVALSVVLLPLLLLGVASWWLTEPLQSVSTVHRAHVAARPVLEPAVGPSSTAGCLEWPADRLEGDAAKRRLLDILTKVKSRIDHVEGYTALFRKQERLDGKLGKLQTMQMKVRNAPFAIYLKFVDPEPGKEVVYCEGRHDNKMIAHSTGWSRRLLPRLALAPTHPLALAENRHPITDAGLASLTNKLLGFRRMDLTDPEAVTILDRITTPDGRTLLRSIHTHPNPNADRPFARVEVLYNPETKFPVEISSFDWPTPGETEELALAERYVYEDLKLDESFSDMDFDPANPAYAFHRY